METIRRCECGCKLWTPYLCTFRIVCGFVIALLVGLMLLSFVS